MKVRYRSRNFFWKDFKSNILLKLFSVQFRRLQGINIKQIVIFSYVSIVLFVYFVTSHVTSI